MGDKQAVSCREMDIHLMLHIQKYGPLHVHTHKRTQKHSGLIENAEGEFSMSFCFMNAIYKVLADSATLLVVSSVVGCAAVEVMTGCE